MVYPFPPDLYRLLQEQMAAGNYSSEDDVLRDALLALDERRRSILEIDLEVVEGIRRGLADVRAGRVQPFAEFDAEMRAKHLKPADG